MAEDLPHLMFKRWDGDEAEYFTWQDMTRVEYNANVCAGYAGVPEVEFAEVTRAGQFDYSEAQRLEDFIAELGDKLGIETDMETAWRYSRSVSYVDFERWEGFLYECYKALGGVGERVDAPGVVASYRAVLHEGDWDGSMPWSQSLTVPALYADTDAMFYLQEDDSVEEVAEARSALLRAVVTGDRRVTVYALSREPSIDIPVKFTIGGFMVNQDVELKAGYWAGEGPWTQTFEAGAEVADAVFGLSSNATDEQAADFARAGITVSGVDGSKVTVRAMCAMPETDLLGCLSYNEVVR